MARKIKEAFKWIVQILEKHDVPFQISGGLAARIYGSKRKLNDIDIEVPNSRIKDILPEVNEHIIFGPKRYVGEGFDVFTLELRYKKEVIDITGCDSGKLFDPKKKRRTKDKVNLSKAIKKRVFGILVPVVSKKNLIKYKKKLMREVDVVDLGSLENLRKNTIEIKKAKKKDAEKISDVLNIQFGKDDKNSDFYKTYSNTKEKILKDMDLCEYYIAIDEMKIVGVVSLLFRNRTCKIDDLAVKTNFQKKGIGTMLVRFSERLAKDRNCKKIWCTTSKSLAAVGFYLSLGFEKSKLVTCWKGRKIITLEKKLSSSPHRFRFGILNSKLA